MWWFRKNPKTPAPVQQQPESKPALQPQPLPTYEKITAALNGRNYNRYALMVDVGKGLLAFIPSMLLLSYFKYLTAENEHSNDIFKYVAPSLALLLCLSLNSFEQRKIKFFREDKEEDLVTRSQQLKKCCSEESPNILHGVLSIPITYFTPATPFFAPALTATMSPLVFGRLTRIIRNRKHYQDNGIDERTVSQSVSVGSLGSPINPPTLDQPLLSPAGSLLTPSQPLTSPVSLPTPTAGSESEPFDHAVLSPETPEQKKRHNFSPEARNALQGKSAAPKARI